MHLFRFDGGRIAIAVDGASHDIIATGTPAGVGPIKRGDRMRIAIERVGEMTLLVK